MANPPTPSHSALDRIVARLGSKPVAWTKVEGGYTAAERWVVRLADGRSLFAKLATNNNTVGWLRAEHRIYTQIAEPYMPRLIGFDDGEYPLLLLADLSAGSWKHRWTPDAIARVRSMLDAVAATPLPPGFPPSTHLSDFDGWREVAKAPAEFLSTGLVSPAWLERALPQLIAAESALDLSGTALVHGDVRSDNLCFLEDRVVLVDWNWAGTGNPLFDLMEWLPSVHAEGGPPPWELHPGDPAIVTALAGFFAVRAGQPPAGAPIRLLQLGQLKAALPWVIRLLGLPPPAP